MAAVDLDQLLSPHLGFLKVLRRRGRGLPRLPGSLQNSSRDCAHSDKEWTNKLVSRINKMVWNLVPGRPSKAKAYTQ